MGRSALRSVTTQNDNIKLSGYALTGTSSSISDEIEVGNNGKVRIRTTTTNGILNVGSSQGYYLSSAFGKVTKSGGGTGSGENKAVTIKATHAIVADRIYAFSDERIKHIKGISDNKTNNSLTQKVATGQYVVSFTTAFADEPTINITCHQPIGGSIRFAVVENITTTTFFVKVYNHNGSYKDSAFSFIAIGKE
ncbi:MAG: hypothetical protein AB8G11_25590 [Saprospiraceae bacterium]